MSSKFSGRSYLIIHKNKCHNGWLETICNTTFSGCDTIFWTAQPYQIHANINTKTHTKQPIHKWKNNKKVPWKFSLHPIWECKLITQELKDLKCRHTRVNKVMNMYVCSQLYVQYRMLRHGLWLHYYKTWKNYNIANDTFCPVDRQESAKFSKLRKYRLALIENTAENDLFFFF